MRQKIRKAVSALSKGQLLRRDQAVAFDVNEPPYFPDRFGACCTTGGAQDGTFCQCTDNVLGRDCCIQGGIHYAGFSCGQVNCCETGPDCFGAFCNVTPDTPAACVEGTRANPPKGDWVFQGCGTTCSDTLCPDPATTNRCCLRCGDGYVDPLELNGECIDGVGLSKSFCDSRRPAGVFTENASCNDSPVCKDNCEEKVTGSCCFLNPNTGELDCLDGTEKFVCDLLNGVFKEGVGCDSDPCSEVVTLCCDTPTTVSYGTCPGFGGAIVCFINSDCTKRVADINDLGTIDCCAQNPGDVAGQVFTDCSCLSDGCNFAKGLPDCDAHLCDDGNGQPSETDCCFTGGEDFATTLLCGEDCP